MPSRKEVEKIQKPVLGYQVLTAVPLRSVDYLSPLLASVRYLHHPHSTDKEDRTERAWYLGLKSVC